MDYHVELREVAPQTIAVVRLRAKTEELSTVVPRACGEVWNFIRANSIPDPGRHVAVYLDKVINLEVGAEVGRPFAGNDKFVCSSTPTGLVATTVHMGPYHLLGQAYGAVEKWCKEHGHTPAGPVWEVYGHWDDDPAKLRTDVFWLLRPAAETAG
jgi:effector-binding domain-containing protein